jgi:hypothetical protein
MMVRAFVPCGEVGGSTPTGLTAGGTPSCLPPQTFSSYRYAPECKGQCKVTLKILKTLCGGTTPCCCVGLQAKCKDILDPQGLPASGPFTVRTVLRQTGDDPLSGDMTVIDLPYGATATATNGKLSLKAGCLTTGADVIPTCAALEVVDLAIYDPNDERFVVPGISCCR